MKEKTKENKLKNSPRIPFNYVDSKNMKSYYLKLQ